VQSVVYPFAGASAPGSAVVSNQPFVGAAADPAANGYWLAASDGGVFSFGAAAFHGSMGAVSLNQPVVGIAPTRTGQGYWLVAADGGVFSFGDAAFHGSMGGVPLNQPVVGIASDTQTGGYWMVAADGGVFSFNAPFYGSRAGQNSIDQFFAMSVTGGGAGYLLAAEQPAP
jgi:hypothetical protein